MEGLAAVRALVGDRSWAIETAGLYGLGQLAMDLAWGLRWDRKPRVLISQIYDRPGSGGEYDDTPPALAMLALAEVDALALELRACECVDADNGEVVLTAPIGDCVPIIARGRDRGDIRYGAWKVQRFVLEDVPPRFVVNTNEFVQVAIPRMPGYFVVRELNAGESAAGAIAEAQTLAASPDVDRQLGEWLHLALVAKYDDPRFQELHSRGVVTAAALAGPHGPVPHVLMREVKVSLESQYSGILESLREIFAASVRLDLPIRWIAGS